jgi:hypothetical protein
MEGASRVTRALTLFSSVLITDLLDAKEAFKARENQKKSVAIMNE